LCTISITSEVCRDLSMFDLARSTFLQIFKNIKMGTKSVSLIRFQQFIFLFKLWGLGTIWDPPPLNLPQKEIRDDLSTKFLEMAFKTYVT
jgi:hypothetical protein